MMIVGVSPAGTHASSDSFLQLVAEDPSDKLYPYGLPLL